MTEIRLQPESPEAIRLEIARTRARMSSTIDELEEVIVAKKNAVQDAVDVPAKIRARPLGALGAAIASGLVLGLLTGGRKRDEADPEANYRSLQWEQRARRLLAIAQEQEAEIERLEADLEEEEFEYQAEQPEDRWYRRAQARLGAYARDADTLLRERVPDYLEAAEHGIRRRFDR